MILCSAGDRAGVGKAQEFCLILCFRIIVRGRAEQQLFLRSVGS